MVKGSIKKYGKKILSIVLTLVMTVGLVNSPAFLESVKAASVDVYVLFDTTVTSSANPKLHVYGNGYDLGWIEPSTFSVVRTSSSGTWYKTTLNPSGTTLNNCPINVIVNGGGDNDGHWVTLSGDSTAYYIVRTSSSSTQVTEEVANNTYGLSGESTTTEAPTEEPTDAPTVETFTFTLVDGTDTTWLGNDSAYFEVVVDGTTYSMSAGSGVWTAEIPTNATNIVVNRKAPDGGTWNSWTIDGSSRGTETTYTATSSSTGQWGTVTTPDTPETFTFTFADGTDTSWLDEASAYFEVVVDGTTYSMSAGSDVWTAEIPTSATNIVVNRKAPDGGTWNSWTIDGSSRGTETIYTATASGEGQWGTVTKTFDFTFVDGTETSWIYDENAVIKIVINPANADDYTGITNMTFVSDEQWTATVPADATSIRVERYDSTGTTRYAYWEIDATARGTNTTYTATGTAEGSDYLGVGQWGIISDIIGNPLTDTKLWDMSHIELDEMTDVNTSSGIDLFEVAATFYNYKSGGGSSWWNQFQNFDNAIMETYYGSDKMRYPLVIGAPDTWYSTGDDQGYRPISGITQGLDTSITNMQALYYVNHNLDYSGETSTSDGIGSGSAVVQGLAGEYLNEDGKLLSSENNVILPFFDDNFLGTLGVGTNGVVDGTWATKYGSKDAPYSFPFRKTGNDIDGYYYEFDSSSGTDNIRVENGGVTYDSSESARVKNGFADYTGFYPFDTNADSGNADALTYGFGARLDIPFNVVNGNVTGNELVSGTSGINSDSVNWMTITLDETIQPGTYQLALKHDGGGFAVTQYKAGDASSAQATTYFKDHKDTEVGGYQSYSDIDYGNEALNNLSDTIVVPITITEATNQISLYGRTWGEQSFTARLYNEGDTIVEPSDDIVFSFSGDDDLWVYVDGKLVLDMGGAHGQASGNINFTQGTVTVNDKYVMDYTTNAVSASSEATTTEVDWIQFDDPTVTHTMTVFYMERGLYDSNLKIGFNFNPIKMSQENGFTVSNEMKLDSVNSAFRDDIFYIMQEDGFHYILNNTTQEDKTLFDNNTLTFPGTGSATEEEKKENEDISASLRDDYVSVSQTEDTRFNTSYSISDTVNNVIIKESTSGLVADDGRDGDDSTSSVFVQNSTVETDNNKEVGVSVDYVNEVKTSSFTIQKVYEGTTTSDYDFEIKYTRLFGKDVSGTFEGVTYNLYEGTTLVQEDVKVGVDSRITLAPGQKAEFTGIPVDTVITVEEFREGTTFKNVVVTGSATTSENGVYTENTVRPSTISVDQNTVSYIYTNGDVESTLVYYTEIGKKTNLPLPSYLSEKAEATYLKTDRDSWTVKASTGNDANGAIDGDAGTRWDTSAFQAVDQWYAIDFGTLHSFDTIEIDSTGSPNDLPKGYEIYAIDDISNIDLTTVRSGNYEKLASVEATTETGTMTIDLGRTEVSRAIIIIQTGSSDANYWSMHELYVYSSASVRDMDIDRSAWKAMAYAAGNTGAASEANLKNALDGNIATRWTSYGTSTETGGGVGDWFGVDFGKAYTYDSIKLELGKSTNDGVAGYEIYALDDATDVASADDIKAKGTLLATGTQSDANGIITVPSTTSRYVYVVQTGTRGNYWSIHEFYAYSSAENKYTVTDVEITKNAYDASPATVDFTTGDYDGNTLAITTTHVGVDELKMTVVDSEGASQAIDIVVYNYNVNDHVYVLDYGLPVNLSYGANGLLGTIEDGGYNYDANTGVTNNQVIKLDSHKDGYTVLGLANNTVGANYDTNLLYQYEATDFAASMSFDQATAALNASRDAIYTPEKFMTNVDEFYYGVQVTKDGYGSGNTGLDATNATPVMSAKVEVMPATVVYYEDNFSQSGNDADGKNGIVYSGTSETIDGTSLNSSQSNSLDMEYGHDDAYINQDYGFSEGSAHKLGHAAVAAFEFKGTGFDIISRTNRTSGMIIVSVYNKNADTAIVKNNGAVTVQNGPANLVRTMVINAYYENGDLYQIPVITWRNDDGTAKDYIVTVTSFNGGDANKTLYLDGVRIYNPAKGNATAESQYDKNNELNAEVKEIKQLIFGEGYEFNYSDPLSSTVGTPYASLVQFLDDGNGTMNFLQGNTVVEAFTEGKDVADEDKQDNPDLTASLMTYAVNGPNNELYLSDGYGFGFIAEGTGKTLQVAVKNVSGNSGLKLQYLTSNIENGSYVWADIAEVKSATETYYRLDTLENKYQGNQVVLKVTGGEGFLSLTNIKVEGYTLSPLSVTTDNGNATSDTSLNASNFVYKLGYNSQKAYFYAKQYATVKFKTSNAVETLKVKNGENDVQLVTMSRKNAGDNQIEWTIKFYVGDQTQARINYSVTAYDKLGNYSEAVVFSE